MGQRRLRAARVLIVGLGGLGSPASLYLAAAGVGKLGLVDFDVVDETNLQRQIIHGTSGIGTAKLDSAQSRLRDINPFVEIQKFDVRLSSENALPIVREFDVVVDGSDNFPTRYLVNDACVLSGKPYVYGSIFRFEGQASVFGASDGPCYRCLFREPPPPDLIPSCAEAGVFGVLPGIVGSIQALEAIKLIVEAGSTLVGRLLLFDALKVSFRELALRKDPACPVCGENPTVRELIDYEDFCSAGTARVDGGLEITPHALVEARAVNPQLTILDVREPYEWEICRIDGSTELPLGELPRRLGELDRRGDIVTVCHHGIRSMLALEILKGAGFSSVRSLRGGIDAWARDVDPQMAIY